jgi:hypothetical protein
MGTPLVVFTEFIEPPQAARIVLLRSARAKGMVRLMQSPPGIVLI